MPYVLESFAQLKGEADIVLVEGAGSASEINLRENDIANMGFARAADVPVVLIGDIDRGGVIASLVGTKAVLDPEDAALVAGFIVNRLRGDSRCSPTAWRRSRGAPAGRRSGSSRSSRARGGCRRRTPTISSSGAAMRGNGRVIVAVPLLPHIANFDDLDPLAAEPDVEVRHGEAGTAAARSAISSCCRARRRPSPISPRCARRLGHRHCRACAPRRHVLGLCGGYQMLGRDASPIRTASRARRDRCRASACSMSTR